MSSGLTIVYMHLQFPTVSLTEPSPSMLIYLEAEIDSRSRRTRTHKARSASRITPSSPASADLSSSAEMSATVMSSRRYLDPPGTPHIVH